jgi:hypothetical protein
VTLSDVSAALGWVGALDNGGPNGTGRDYDSDVNANGVEDGAEYDRSPNGVGLSRPPSGAVCTPSHARRGAPTKAAEKSLLHLQCHFGMDTVPRVCRSCRSPRASPQKQGQYSLLSQWKGYFYVTTPTTAATRSRLSAARHEARSLQHGKILHFVIAR